MKSGKIFSFFNSYRDTYCFWAVILFLNVLLANRTDRDNIQYLLYWKEWVLAVLTLVMGALSIYNAYGERDGARNSLLAKLVYLITFLFPLLIIIHTLIKL